jgi:hypothetical protein
MLLIDTRDDRPEPPEKRRPLWLDLPELRPWRFFAAGIVCFVLSEFVAGWPSLIPLWIGFGLVLRGITSYYRGNDGLSKYRQ